MPLSTQTSRKLPPGVLALLATAVLAAGSVAAQDTPPGELVTDRPDQTESAVVVAPGYVQVETGVLFTRDEEGPAEVEGVEGPGTLVRIGVGGRTELRLGWAGWIRQEVRFAGGGEATVDGAGDAEIGAKVRLRDEAGPLPETALLVGVSLPLGDEELTSDRYDPSILLSLAHTLSERLALGYNAGVAWSSAPGEAGAVETASHAVWSAALGLGLAERLGAFVELFGEEPIDAPGSSAVSADGGFTWLVRPNLQLDLSAGAGLTDEAPDWFVGAGVSFRLPR